MPVHSSIEFDKSKVYFYVYNKGAENRDLFNDKQDCNIFLGYLKDYLTASDKSDSTRRNFLVNDRSFGNIPNQPTNYFKILRPITHSLKLNHFCLLIKSLFQSQSETAQITNASGFQYLIGYFHHNFTKNSSDLTDDYFSNIGYLNATEIS